MRPQTAFAASTFRTDPAYLIDAWESEDGLPDNSARGDCLLLLPVSYELEIGYIPGQFYIENSYLAFRNIDWIDELKIG